MKYFYSILLFLIFTQAIVAQNEGTVRGIVLDKTSGESMIGANIAVVGTDQGTVTDIDGNFDLNLVPGTYSLQISYLGFQELIQEGVVVTANKVTLLTDIFLSEDAQQLDEIVVTAQAVRTTEAALSLIKKNSSVILDGISASKMKLIGDGNAVEAAKRVTGVSVEGGKYVYVRGLGDRYIKTMMNNTDIPGLDPDKNTLQMDIFPTSLISSILVAKNFTAELPADFTGGMLNLETKDFPEERVLSVSVGTTYNPQMHFNDKYLSYKGSSTDFLGFDDGQRKVPLGARADQIPTPVSGASGENVKSFVKRFDNTLAASTSQSKMDLNGSITYADQFAIGGKNKSSSPKIGYMFSASYKSNYQYFDDVEFGEYQRLTDPSAYEIVPATVQTGSIGERSFLVGLLGGVAFKTQYTKIRLTAMHLQNGVSRAGKFEINNDGERVGQSGYYATSDNLEYNQRGLTNILLNGVHASKSGDWQVDWRVSPTLSFSDDPDIRKTAFTTTNIGTQFFSAGAGGNPSRIWRSLEELNGTAKVDITKKYDFKGRSAKLKFGLSQNYKDRDYEILFYDLNFFGSQSWNNTDASQVLIDENIFPSSKNNIYYQSGNNNPNPNQYSSQVYNTAAYVSNEMELVKNLKTVIGLRVEKFVQYHTGRDQRFASGDSIAGRNLDNGKVLDNLNFFPTLNFIYALKPSQNIRLGYGRTIARPSFKELSFAQIIDPITNRIFNGSLFAYPPNWDGNLVATNVDNIDLRYEIYTETGGLYSISPFYKRFNNPIELVRIPEQQTSTEYQTRNVGDGQLFGIELEVRTLLGKLAPALNNLEVSGNLTLVNSRIDMTDVEFNARKGYERTGETIGKTRQMAGQSPYIVNGGLSYRSVGSDFNVGLFYNVKGPTLFIVGAGLFPDIVSQPFHSLNFSFQKKLGKDRRASVDFKVSNILNSATREYYKSYKSTNQTFSIFKPGVAFSVDFSYSI